MATADAADAAAAALDRAVTEELIRESARKSALVWVRGPAGPARPLWHVWHDGAVCLVGEDGPAAGAGSEGAPEAAAGPTGAREQPLDGLGLVDGSAATVTCRSKDKGGRLVVWPARVVQPPADSAAWREAAEQLKGKRLNAPDADALLERWARRCRVLRLEPAGAASQHPGAMPTESLAEPPLPTPASTRVAAPTGLPVRRSAGGRLSRRRPPRSPRPQ